MTLTNRTRIIPAMATTDGAGVAVYRSIGTPTLRNYDPFLLLDHISSKNPEEYMAGFPPHPHRGFNTFTYMIDGYMKHRDSMGNTGNLGPGGAQWMKAASGVIHSEMPEQKNGLMRGIQLWINLPAANKMDSPEYQEYQSDAFPVITTPDYNIKVLIGSLGNVVSPIVDDITHVYYFDVQVHAGRHFKHLFSTQHNSLLYVYEGSGQFNGQALSEQTLVASGTDTLKVDFIASNQGARFILVSGKPINENIVQHGPFVMNTSEEIRQAIKNFQSNSLIHDHV